MDASSSRSRYQGYPYVNPHSYDAPSVDQATASRWANLPRTQICTINPYVKFADRAKVEQSTVEGREPSSSMSRMALPIKPEANETPVVYIDLPEDTGGSDVTQYREDQTEFTQGREPSSSTSGMVLPIKPEPNETPVVYVDLPENTGGSDVTQYREDQTQFTQGQEPSSSTSRMALPIKPEANETPVVYIDFPEDTGGSDVTQYREERHQTQFTQGQEPSSSTSSMALPIKPEANETPVVYIDLPEDTGGSDVTQYWKERHQTQFTQRQEEPSSSSTQLPFKPEPDENPVVYIDLPDGSGSEVSQNREERLSEPEFVQETIFYDPFENRRIDMVKPPGTVRSNTSWNSESDLDSVSDVPPRPPPPRPVRPRVLDLTSNASGSSTPPLSTLSSTTSMFPPSLSDSYTRTLPRSNLPSPLSLADFPEPPPAYTEFEISTPVVDPPRPQLPMTQVITPGPAVGLPNLDRKFLKCHHCGMQVHTLVIRESGVVTHMSAVICLIICMLPIVLMIYCMDCLKNKNHLCPNCNKTIGYEFPLSGGKVVYLH